MSPLESRPPLGAALSAAEFVRWYWLKEELQAFARRLGIRAAGSKEVLTARIAATLAGTSFTEPRAVARGGRQLSGTLSAGTVIPKGQRCSQSVREWLVQQVGPSFHFDEAMRDFFEESDGTQTLGDAVKHWHATRDASPRSISAQFEYNRFTRAWHAAHPEGTREDLLSAWNDYRSRPIDERGRV